MVNNPRFEERTVKLRWVQSPASPPFANVFTFSFAGKEGSRRILFVGGTVDPIMEAEVARQHPEEIQILGGMKFLTDEEGFMRLCEAIDNVKALVKEANNLERKKGIK